MPANNVEIRFSPTDSSGQNIAKILREAADRFEQGDTRFPIYEPGKLIGGALLETAEDIEKSVRIARFLNG